MAFSPLAAKLHAASLGQALTCDPINGLRCINLENDKDCYDYEISFFCECEELSTVTPPETSTSFQSFQQLYTN